MKICMQKDCIRNDIREPNGCTLFRDIDICGEEDYKVTNKDFPNIAIEGHCGDCGKPPYKCDCQKVVQKYDIVNEPNHYKAGKYECYEVVKELIKDMAGLEGALFFNVFKYLWRYKGKNGIEDLKKARNYLNKLIQCNEEVIK